MKKISLVSIFIFIFLIFSCFSFSDSGLLGGWHSMTSRTYPKPLSMTSIADSRSPRTNSAESFWTKVKRFFRSKKNNNQKDIHEKISATVPPNGDVHSILKSRGYTVHSKRFEQTPDNDGFSSNEGNIVHVTVYNTPHELVSSIIPKKFSVHDTYMASEENPMLNDQYDRDTDETLPAKADAHILELKYHRQLNKNDIDRLGLGDALPEGTNSVIHTTLPNIFAE